LIFSRMGAVTPPPVIASPAPDVAGEGVMPVPALPPEEPPSTVPGQPVEPVQPPPVKPCERPPCD
jgi:hypothetical protein